MGVVGEGGTVLVFKRHRQMGQLQFVQSTAHVPTRLATLPAEFTRGHAPRVPPRPQGFWTDAPGSPAKTPSHSETLQASSVTDWDGGVVRNKLGFLL